MRSSGCRPYIYIYLYIYISIYLSIVHDSASVESTRGGSLTLAPIIPEIYARGILLLHVHCIVCVEIKGRACCIIYLIFALPLVH